MRDDVTELLNRQFQGGTSVTNCVAHMRLSILDRPDGCKLCQADVRNTLSRVIRVNEWLNQWINDAEKILEDI